MKEINIENYKICCYRYGHKIAITVGGSSPIILTQLGWEDLNKLISDVLNQPAGQK